MFGRVCENKQRLHDLITTFIYTSMLDEREQTLACKILFRIGHLDTLTRIFCHDPVNALTRVLWCSFGVVKHMYNYDLIMLTTTVNYQANRRKAVSTTLTEKYSTKDKLNIGYMTYLNLGLHDIR